MTALERQMAADAVALSKEHADRADAAEARWAELRAAVKRDRDTYYDLATDLADEGKDAGRTFGRVGTLDEVLALMARLAPEPVPTHPEEAKP